MSMEGGPRSIEPKSILKEDFSTISLPFHHLTRKLDDFYLVKHLDEHPSISISLDNFVKYINENISPDNLKKNQPGLQTFHKKVRVINDEMGDLLRSFTKSPHQDVISIPQKVYDELEELRKAYTELTSAKA